MLLYALDVAEQHRGRGYGAAFVREASDRGCTEVWVLTEHDNEAALATYVSVGGTPGRGAPVMVTWKLAEGRQS